MLEQHYHVTVTATNGRGEALGSLTIKVFPQKPSYLGTFTDQDATEGSLFNYEAGPHFTGRNLTFSATGLPDGLSIDAESGVISGTPAA